MNNGLLYATEAVFIIQRKTWGMGAYAGADYKLTLSSELSATATIERGGVGKVSTIGWAHLQLSAT